MTLVLPFVNRGSGSFLKKDFNKLLMTLRSRHFCRVDQGSFRLMQFLQYESITVQRCCQGSGALYSATWLSVTHVFLDVDVIHAFAVELLLHAGDGSVVPRDPVDSCVLQASLLHNLAAHLHNERNILHKLHKKKKKNQQHEPYRSMTPHTVSSSEWVIQSGCKDAFYLSWRNTFHLHLNDNEPIFKKTKQKKPVETQQTHLVTLCRWTIIKSDTKSDASWSLFLKWLPYDPWNGNFPSTSVPWWTGLIWQVKRIQIEVTCTLTTLNDTP